MGRDLAARTSAEMDRRGKGKAVDAHQMISK
jgi:hypothetical protein